MTIEICCSDIHSVRLAEIYGADAIELCVDLEHGGLSPSAGMIALARKIFSKELAVFLRPRNGDFIYDPLEQELILSDMKRALDLGADAIVAGGLDKDGNLDQDFMHALIDQSMGATLVYHRAIDIATDPEQLLNQLIDLQIDRVLSSGCQTTAFLGAERLKAWNIQSDGQIEIMAAGGIDETNVIDLLQKSGLKRFHCSLRTAQSEPEGILKLGRAEDADEKKMKKLMRLFGR